MLENLLSDFERPCVMDIKIGTRQHGDDASPEKRAKAIQRCASTTSKTLGLRCSGMRVLYGGGGAPPADTPTPAGAKGGVAGSGASDYWAEAGRSPLSSSLPTRCTPQRDAARERTGHHHSHGELRLWDKQYGKLLKQDTFHEALQQFFDSGHGLRTQVRGCDGHKTCVHWTILLH